MSAILSTLDELTQLSGIHDAVIVACSFGKDSLIALDLCAKTFKRVEVLHLCYAPDMALTAERCQYVRDRWGIDVTVEEHPGASQHRHDGYRCFPNQDVPRRTFGQAFADAKKRLNCTLVVTGIRASESLGRMGGISRGQRGEKVADYFGDYQPLAHWRHNKQYSDVATYLKNHDIEPYEPIYGSRHGMGNDAATILMLHDRYPGDYRKWCRVFPLASTVVARRKLYGIG